MFNLEERRHWQRSPALVPHKGSLAPQTAHTESLGTEIQSNICQMELMASTQLSTGGDGLTRTAGGFTQETFLRSSYGTQRLCTTQRQAGPGRSWEMIQKRKPTGGSMLNHLPAHFAIFMFTPKSNFIHSCQNSCSHSADEALGPSPS